MPPQSSLFCQTPLQIKNILRKKPDGDCRGRRQTLLNFPVCQPAFRKLLGLGSQRFHRLRTCADNDEAIPIDGRTLPRASAHASVKKSQNRELICEFLEELRHSMAEPMPEATGGSSNAPRHMSFRRNRGRKPKLAAKFNRLKLLHKVSKKDGEKPTNNKPPRFLPPGTFSDYLSLFRLRHPGTRVGLKLFGQVPRLA